MYSHTYILIHTHVHSHKHTGTHTSTHMYAYTLTHIHTHMYTYTLTHMYTYTLIHIYTYIHMHTHSTQTYTPTSTLCMSEFKQTIACLVDSTFSLGFFNHRPPREAYLSEGNEDRNLRLQLHRWKNAPDLFPGGERSFRGRWWVTLLSQDNYLIPDCHFLSMMCTS